MVRGPRSGPNENLQPSRAPTWPAPDVCSERRESRRGGQKRIENRNPVVGRVAGRGGIRATQSSEMGVPRGASS